MLLQVEHKPTLAAYITPKAGQVHTAETGKGAGSCNERMWMGHVMM